MLFRDHIVAEGQLWCKYNFLLFLVFRRRIFRLLVFDLISFADGAGWWMLSFGISSLFIILNSYLFTSYFLGILLSVWEFICFQLSQFPFWNQESQGSLGIMDECFICGRKGQGDRRCQRLDRELFHAFNLDYFMMNVLHY